MRFAFLALSGSISIVVFAACGGSDGDGRQGFEVTGDSGPNGSFGADAAEAAPLDATFDACAAVAVTAKQEKLPVDIIWVVDNSSSMQAAIVEVQAGLNDFALRIGSKGLDYKVIMLSLRGTSPITGGSTRYPVCIPPPLGGADCGNTPLFFHAPLDVQSTQPLEQILGTLSQTQGYTPGNARGGEPWAAELRPNATKSFVLVTDDNSRFPNVSFETFPGGPNPNTNGLVLPPGILDSSRGGAFKGYIFNAIYGWGGVDPSIRCTFPDGTKPAASGAEYTTLVAKTKGARAQLCAGSAAWGPFFDGVATAVSKNARVACELAIPTLDAGAIDPAAVNVQVDKGSGPAVTLAKVPDEIACGGAAGWYYDNPAAPKTVKLCPLSCDDVQSADAPKPPQVKVLFGCATLVR